MNETKTATWIRELPVTWDSPVVRAALYRVDPPMTRENYDINDEGEYVSRTLSSPYVCVSASNVPFSGPETYIFLADDQGDVINDLECDGSFRGALSHREALENAGYTVDAGADNVPEPQKEAGMTDAQCDMLVWVERLLDQQYQRLRRLAPKKVDREIIAREISGIRLEVLAAREILREVLGMEVSCSTLRNALSEIVFTSGESTSDSVSENSPPRPE